MTDIDKINRCYRFLGLKPGTPLFYVRKAYKELATACEQDVAEGDVIIRQRAEKKLKQLKIAYKTIVLSGMSSEVDTETAPAEEISPAPSPAPVLEVKKSPVPQKPKTRPTGIKKAPEPESKFSILRMIVFGLVSACAVLGILHFGKPLLFPAKEKNSEFPDPGVSLEVAERREIERRQADMRARLIEKEQTAIAERLEEKRATSAVKLKEAAKKKKKETYKKKLSEKELRLRELAILKKKMAQNERIQTKKIRRFLKKTNGRYVEEKSGVIVDTETNLRWAMLNSYLRTGKCLDHDTAVRYVRELGTGGYRWRFPDAREMSEIYVRKPVYPSGGANWFWTGKVFTRGWKKVATVIKPNSGGVIKEDWAYLTQCGVVHPVKR